MVFICESVTRSLSGGRNDRLRRKIGRRGIVELRDGMASNADEPS